MAYEKVFRTAGGIYYFCENEGRNEERKWIRSTKDHIKTHNGGWELLPYMCLGSFNPKENPATRKTLWDKLCMTSKNAGVAVAGGLTQGSGHIDGFLPVFHQGNLLVRAPIRYMDQIRKVENEMIDIKGARVDHEVMVRTFDSKERPNETVWTVLVDGIEFKIGPLIDEVYQIRETRFKRD